MSSRWDSRPPSVIGDSGHGGTIALVMLLLSLAGALGQIL